MTSKLNNGTDDQIRLAKGDRPEIRNRPDQTVFHLWKACNLNCLNRTLIDIYIVKGVPKIKVPKIRQLTCIIVQCQFNSDKVGCHLKHLIT